MENEKASIKCMVQHIFKLEAFAETFGKFSSDEQLSLYVLSKRAHAPYSALIDHAYWIHSLSILSTHQVRLSSPL